MKFVTLVDDTYNGWSNYETWNWKLWLDNDQGTYSYWQERIEEIKAAEYTPDYEWETPESLQVRTLAEELEAECDTSMEELPTVGPFADILDAGIGRINWREIAENMLSD